MGATCCKENSHQDKIMESHGRPSISEYREEAWPSDDHFLIKQLQNSKTVDIRQGNKPLKHKSYEQWYMGDWNHGQPKGKGVLYNRQNKKHIYYEGQFDGQPNGKGRVIYNDGQYQYQGDIKNSKATGYGKMKNNKEGYEFDGIWKDSKMHKGTLTIRPDSDGFFGSKTYKGDTLVEIDEQKFENVIRYPDGRVYVGQIDKAKFLPDGRGKVTFPNGSSYDGEWKDGQMHGQGYFSWKDGSSYKGQYYHNKKQGRGTFIFPTGNRYQGHWDKGVQDGKGILYSRDNTELESGEWDRGKFVGEKKKSVIF